MRQMVSLIALVIASSMMMGGKAHASDQEVDFDMVVSGGAKTCLPNAAGHVKITSTGPVESMAVTVQGLPPNTDFDFFVIQVPTAPFGLAWYQGDIQTDYSGGGSQTFVGRFSIETFIVAPGQAPAPVVFTDPNFPDQASNLGKEGPVQLYHLGMWFNSPVDAGKAGCASTKTPFNGEHNAGIQVLNTNNFPIGSGPLIQIHP